MNGALFRRTPSTVKSSDPFKNKSFIKTNFLTIYSKFVFDSSTVVEKTYDSSDKKFEDMYKYSYTYSNGILTLTKTHWATEQGWMTLSQIKSAYASQASSEFEYSMAEMERSAEVSSKYYCTVDKGGNVTLVSYYTGDLAENDVLSFRYTEWNDQSNQFDYYLSAHGQSFYMTSGSKTWSFLPTSFSNGSFAGDVYEDQGDDEYSKIGTMSGTYTNTTAGYEDGKEITLKFTTLPNAMKTAGWQTNSNYTLEIYAQSERTISFAVQ